MTTVHASCVAVDGRGLLIRGPSGAGKSALALDLIGLGAALVADDQVGLSRHGGSVLAAPPPALAGLIEARGLGVLRLPFADTASVLAVLDLDAPPAPRLPEAATTDLLGVPVRLFATPCPLQPIAIFLMLRHWPLLDPDAEEVR